jgi:hypothetical protein
MITLFNWYLSSEDNYVLSINLLSLCQNMDDEHLHNKINENRYVLRRHSDIENYIRHHTSSYPLANEVAKRYSNATVRPSVLPSHPCEHSRINTLQ